jgi:polyisoprenoid-binding protein YceI
LNKLVLATVTLCLGAPVAFAQTTTTTPAAPASPAAPAPAATAAPAPAAPAAVPAAGVGSIAPGVTLAPKSLEVKAGHYKLDPDHGKVTWSVSHLGYSTYVGQFAKASADLVLDPHDPSKMALTATVDTTSVGSFNPKLDTYLNGEGFLDTKVYPTATFKASKITVTGPQTARVDGDLTLRGKTFPIVISATFNNAGIDPIDKQYTVGFDGASIIRRSTFGVSQFLPLIGDNVTLRIEGEFKPVQ